MRLVLALALSAALLAGCGDKGGAEAKPDPNESPEPAVAKEYGAVTALRDAAIEAGYVCDAWEQDNVVALAAESGRCSDDDVFATFASEGDKQAQLDTNREIDELLSESGIDPDPTLIGPNWSIKGPHADALIDALGGTLVSR